MSLLKYLTLLCIIASLSSCYSVKNVGYNSYTVDLVNKSGELLDTGLAVTYYDSSISATLAVGKKEISFVMRNKTDNTIKIIWDECLFFRNGNQSKVMHSGVKFTDRNQSMPPSVIPAGTRFDDVIIPTDNVFWKEGYYSRYGSSPGGWEQKDLFPSYTSTGDKFSLFMPMRIGSSVKEYNFNFKIRETKTDYRKEKVMNVEGTTGLIMLIGFIPILFLLL